jgi:hypothetical protein
MDSLHTSDPLDNQELHDTNSIFDNQELHDDDTNTIIDNQELLVRTDNLRENISTDYFQNDIRLELTEPHTSEQNGTAESVSNETILSSANWTEAMLNEQPRLSRCNENMTYWHGIELPIPLLSARPPIRSRWIFTVKYRLDGSIERYEARLVARGDSQNTGIVFNAPYAPVADIFTTALSEVTFNTLRNFM